MHRVIPVIVVRLVYLNARSNSADATFDDFATALITSIHVSLSITVSCIPFIKPVMDSLETGILASDVHSSSQDAKSGYALRWPGTSSPGKARPGAMKGPEASNHGNCVTVSTDIDNEDRAGDLNMGSRDQLVIKQTRTAAVDVQRPRFP